MVSGHMPTDQQALRDRRMTGCQYDVGTCVCPSAPFEYDGCKARRPQPEPRLYVVDLSTGEATGGPEPGTVQHYDRETFELQVHEYAPDSCDRCAELRDMGYR